MKKSKHHLIPKSGRGEFKRRYTQSEFDRTLMLWRHKHDIWHILFKNQTLEETVAILERIKKIKCL